MKCRPFDLFTPDVHRGVSEVEDYITLLKFLNEELWSVIGRDVYCQWWEVTDDYHVERGASLILFALWGEIGKSEFSVATLLLQREARL